MSDIGTKEDTSVLDESVGRKKTRQKKVKREKAKREKAAELRQVMVRIKPKLYSALEVGRGHWHCARGGLCPLLLPARQHTVGAPAPSCGCRCCRCRAAPRSRPAAVWACLFCRALAQAAAVAGRRGVWPPLVYWRCRGQCSLLWLRSVAPGCLGCCGRGVRFRGAPVSAVGSPASSGAARRRGEVSAPGLAGPSGPCAGGCPPVAWLWRGGTRLNSSSVSMVAPTILCRRSECRRAPVGAGLRVPRFPGRPPGTTGSREDEDVIAVDLDPEHLVTSGHCLPRREPEDLAGWSPDLQFLAVLIPISRHHSLNRDCLLFRPKTTFVAAEELQIHAARVILDPRRDNLAGYTAPALPRLSAAF